jgi:hypothetical protein
MKLLVYRVYRPARLLMLQPRPIGFKGADPASHLSSGAEVSERLQVSQQRFNLKSVDTLLVEGD